MDFDGGDILDLYGGDDTAARNQASMLAQAIRQRRAAGMLGMITGDPAMAGVGKEFMGSADQMQGALFGAAQHRAQQDIQRQHLSVQQKQIDATNAYRDAMLGLKANEQGAAQDAFGNPVLYQKHGAGGGMLPGAVAASGGGTAPAGGPRRAGPVAGGGGSMLTPDAIDQAAEAYYRTGTVPQLGRGKAAASIIAKIANRAAELHPDADLAGNKAGYQADTKSLGHLQQQADNIEAFEKTGKKNIENLLASSQRIVDLGSPMLNKPARWIASNVQGDPNMAAFEAARQTAAVESAKILSGALGPLSDSSRHEAERMMDPNATPEQLAAAARTLIADFANRRAANVEQLTEIRSRTGARGGRAAAVGGAAPAPSDTVTVMWKGKPKSIPRARLQEALSLGATEAK